MRESKDTDAVSQETHEEEMARLKLEIQQCKDFIATQQQLLQVRETSPQNVECLLIESSVFTVSFMVFKVNIS